MRFADPIKISYKNIVAAKWRSFLTVLGIIIGIGSVIVIMAIGSSAQSLILSQISGVGSNLIGVLPGASSEKGPPAQALGIITTTMKYDDFLALIDKRNVPEVSDGAAYIQGTDFVSYGSNDVSLGITGVTHSYPDVEDAEVDAGRFFLPEEDTNLARVAVLGSTAKTDLFGTDNAINKKIKIKSQTFTVIGVMKTKGSSSLGAGGSDDSVLLPLKTTQKIVLGMDYLSFIRLKVADVNDIGVAKDDITKTLRIQHNIKNPVDDDFSVRDVASALDTIKNVTDILKYFLLSVGSISLIVGGVGIMNIMLITVNQRIREVGLRKSVGAKNSDIMLQFLMESATITLVGGIIGIILGILSSFLISVIVTNGFGYDWQFIVSLQSVIVATVVSVLIGLIFGMYPARKAAEVSPMEALRYE
ncbi:MAG: ABC transporter permease [Parcubacteria group bacterium]